MSDLMKKDGFPITTTLFGGGLPSTPHRRPNNFIGRQLKTWELRQLKEHQALQADIATEFVRCQEVQEKFVTNEMTRSDRLKAMLAELNARETIANAKGEEALLSLAEKKLEYQIKNKTIKKRLDEMEGES